MRKGLSQQVRADSVWVAARARHVKINLEAIPDYAARLLASSPLVTKMDDVIHFVDRDRPALTVAYFLALDSINFGSGYFGAAASVGVGLEYAPVASRLKEAFISGRLTTPQEWVSATAGDMHDILSIPVAAHPRLDELMALFALHLRQTGTIVLRDYAGDVMTLVENCRHDARQLVDCVGQWPHFADRVTYDGRDLGIYKRAQILAADIALALASEQGLFLSHTDDLTIFADNMVPAVLRHDGLLSYAPDLAACIDAGEGLLAGSAEEVELRFCAIHVVELMKAALHQQGHTAISSMNLDHLLWHRGYEPEVYATPRHGTLSTWY